MWGAKANAVPRRASPLRYLSTLVPTGFAVTGGYVYRGSEIPGFRGRYLYGDYTTGRTWSFLVVDGAATDLREHTLELGLIRNLASFGEDSNGELYICDFPRWKTS